MNDNIIGNLYMIIPFVSVINVKLQGFFCEWHVGKGLNDVIV